MAFDGSEFAGELDNLLRELENAQTLTDAEKSAEKLLESWFARKGLAESSPQISVMLSTVLALILIHRRRNLVELSQDAPGFIMTFLKTISPTKVVGEDFNETLREAFFKIPIGTWSAIASPPKPNVSIAAWENLDAYGGEPREEEYSLVYKIKNDLQKQFGDRITVYPRPVSGSYRDYLKNIDNSLRIGFLEDDLILMDSSLLAEYKAKGVFATIQNYCWNEIKLLEEMTDNPSIGHVLNLGKTDNGYVEAIPMTLNYHLPACTMEGKHNIIKDILPFKNGNFQELASIKTGSFKDKLERLYDKNINLNLFTKPDAGKHSLFITFNPNGGYVIPMQLARGAHATYTTFAYFSFQSTQRMSFMTLKKDDKSSSLYLEIIDPHSRELLDRVKLFLSLIFQYVPMISLCLDHISSGIFRCDSAVKENWFDPCLPIEAEKFQVTSEGGDIFFNGKPMKHLGNALSCLGGYCLALHTKCDSKSDAARAAIQLAENYSKWERPSETAENENKKYDRCRIPYLDLEIDVMADSKEKKINRELFLPPGIDIKRPSFAGWQLLEEQISETVRLYVTATMIFRAIACEVFSQSKKTKGRKWYESIQDYSVNPEKGGYSSINENSIRMFLESSRNIMKSFFENSINLLASDHEGPTIKTSALKKTVKSLQSNLDSWLDSNLNCLVADRSALSDLLRSGILALKGDNSCPDKVIDYFAERMLDSLNHKITTLADSHGWDYKIRKFR